MTPYFQIIGIFRSSFIKIENKQPCIGKSIKIYEVPRIIEWFAYWTDDPIRNLLSPKGNCVHRKTSAPQFITIDSH